MPRSIASDIFHGDPIPECVATYDLYWEDPNLDGYATDMNGGLLLDDFVNDSEEDIEWLATHVHVGEEFSYVNRQGLTINVRRTA